MSKDKPNIKKADSKFEKEVLEDPAFYNDQIDKNNKPAKTLKKGKG